MYFINFERIGLFLYIKFVFSLFFVNRKIKCPYPTFWITRSGYGLAKPTENEHPFMVETGKFDILFSNYQKRKQPLKSRKQTHSRSRMSGALFRNVATDAARLIRRNAAAADPFGDVRRLQSRLYFRSPQVLGRAKETGLSPPSFYSGFCSSSSSSSASLGFVGWYLGMVKSRPVFTKSVTSSLIYIAADLSSQVLLSNCFWIMGFLFKVYTFVP